MLSTICSATWALFVCPAIVAELHHRTACSGNPSCSCLNNLLNSSSGLGFEFRIWIQVRMERALTTMTNPCALVHISAYSQWWNVTKYIHSNTVLEYKFEVLSLNHFMLLYFYSATSQRQILYFLLRYIYLTDLDTLQI